MARTSFELIFDYSDNRTQIIKHEEMGLYLKVLPERFAKERYAADDIALIATFYKSTLNGPKLKDHSSQTHFLVMKAGYEKRVLWDSHLLIDAVGFYCREHLNQKYDELHVVIQGRRALIGAEDFHH